MDEIEVKSGKPTFISEIVEDMNGDSVCITGRLTEHMVDICQGKLSDPQGKADVSVDTSLIEPFDAKIGSLFQMIGELETNVDKVALKARVVRCVDGMDMALYRKVVQTQRVFFEKRNRQT